jgi:IS605 OrfB family transposase
MPSITYNTPLIFSCQEDKKALVDVLLAHTFVFNECSKIKFLRVPENSLVKLHLNFYHNFRKTNNHIPSQVIIRAEHECLATYRSISSNKHKILEPVSKTNHSMRLDKRCYSLKNETFSIISLDKRVKCKLHIYPKLQEMLEKYTFCDPLLFLKNGEIYISLPFNVPEVPISINKLAVGIDLGIRNFAATSEGNLYQDKGFNSHKRKLRFLKRKLQGKAYVSNSAKKKLKKLRRKEANGNKNFVHHLANAVIKDTKANILVLENLKSIKVKKHKYQNKNRISQVSLHEMQRILTYKAILHKKQVITVCPSYTSQIDHRTGKRDGIRKGCRYYGADGKILHADINAAINIALRSKHPISQIGFANLPYGQAKVNRPIVNGLKKPFASSQPCAVSS